MNELISKLFKQSGGSIEIENGNFWTYTTENYDPELFADSIVWECMKICEDVMKKDNSALGCWSEIKRTFRS
jgi:hypothetical protein